jgi:protein-disulfide isomerase
MIRTLAVTIAYLALTGAALAQKADSSVVAVVDGKPISADELHAAAAPDLQSLEDRKAQFEIQLERDKKTALEGALDKIIADRLLAAEAAKRKVSADELVAIEVDGAVQVPSDETIARFYDANKSSLGGTLSENAAAIRTYLQDQQRQKIYDAFIGRLKKEHGAQAYLQPARTNIPTLGRPSKGPAGAPVTLVEFSDFQCPFCGGLFPTLKQIQADYKDKLRFVYLQFPLVSIHSNAAKAAEASLCAYEQGKFWELHDAMFSDQQNLSLDDLKKKASQFSVKADEFNSCLDSGKYLPEIRADIKEGVKAGVDGTPAMFINGRFLGGNVPYSEIQKVIDDELQRAGAN